MRDACLLLYIAYCMSPLSLVVNRRSSVVERRHRRAAATVTSAHAHSAAPAAPSASVGKIYRILSGGDIRSLEPPGAEGSEDWWSAGLVLYNYLYSYDKEGKLFPDLAADLPKISGDGKVYTISLRKGVKFHNGREMTAADAKFSLEWQLWPDTYSWGKTYVDNI